MATVRFWEKRGCQGNARQKALLIAAGHDLEVCDLLTTPWTSETLLPFLASLPPNEWFNRAAPAVQSGAVNPERLDREQALQLLLSSPILIRRPLLQVGDERQVGFDAARIHAWIGLGDAAPRDSDLESCPRR